MKRDEDYLKLVDGVKVLNFGSGHAWGMIGLEIETEELGTIILASDAIYTKESMEPTLKPPGILYDSVGWTNSVEKIKISSREKCTNLVWPRWRTICQISKINRRIL